MHQKFALSRHWAAAGALQGDPLLLLLLVLLDELQDVMLEDELAINFLPDVLYVFVVLPNDIDRARHCCVGGKLLLPMRAADEGGKKLGPKWLREYSEM